MIVLKEDDNLKPVGVLGALLSGENLDEAFVLVAAHVAGVGPGEMAIEGSGIELGENIDLGDVAVQAVADWNINQPVVGSKGNSRLRPLLRQRVETSPGPSSENNAQHTLHNHNSIDQKRQCKKQNSIPKFQSHKLKNDSNFNCQKQTTIKQSLNSVNKLNEPRLREKENE